MAVRLGRLICGFAVLGLVSIWLALSPANAQQAPILTVDQERLFAESLWGKRSNIAMEAEGTAIIAENQRLDNELSKEEAELTELRKTLDAQEFRARADEFDTRATKIRRERALAVQELGARIDADQNAFYQAAAPILHEVMLRNQAVAVLDRRTVLAAVESIDITDELIAELDVRIGEGPLYLPSSPSHSDQSETQSDAP